MTRVLVTGATGAIGPSLVQHLIAEGQQVRILAHRPERSELFKAVACIQGDICNRSVLQAAVANVDTVFHLAAKLHINDPLPDLRAEYERVNVEGTRALVEAACRAGVQRLIFFSTISVYGPGQPGRSFDETSPLNPDSWYAETKARAEQIALAALPCTVLRLVAVYGPRMKGNYVRLLRALQRGRFVMVGDGRNRRTLVHVEDACAAALLAAEHPTAVGQVYNVSDGQVHTLSQIVAAMCRAFGKSPPRVHLPITPVRWMVGALEDSFGLLGKRAPIGRATLAKWTEDIAVSAEKIQRHLGFRPRYDLLTGWRDTVAE